MIFSTRSIRVVAPPVSTRTPKRGMYAPMARVAARRRARSAGESWACGVYRDGPEAARLRDEPLRNPAKLLRLGVGRPGYARAGSGWPSGLRSIARRLLVFRSNFRPAFLWRMGGFFLVLLLHRCFQRSSIWGQLSIFIPREQSHVRQDLFDFLQALPARSSSS